MVGEPRYGGNVRDPQPQYGGKIKKRLSYVEHSYKQLTNNVYSSGADWRYFGSCF